MALQVIGAGWGRTGTMSLKKALEALGFGPCHHMMEVIANQASLPLWIAAGEGRADWDAMFSGYASMVDFPGCTYWRELADYYPDAKVLLSVRDPEEWFESTQATIFSPAAVKLMGNSPLEPFIRTNVWRHFGDRIHDREFMIDAFTRHVADVQRSVAPERLLTYSVSEGWEPLCAFLGVPVPATPFPRSNSREEMQAMLADHGMNEPGGAMDMDKARESVKARMLQ
jgi:hypothetical protein